MIRHCEFYNATLPVPDKRVLSPFQPGVSPQRRHLSLLSRNTRRFPVVIAAVALAGCSRSTGTETSIDSPQTASTEGRPSPPSDTLSALLDSRPSSNNRVTSTPPQRSADQWKEAIAACLKHRSDTAKARSTSTTPSGPYPVRWDASLGLDRLDEIDEAMAASHDIAGVDEFFFVEYPDPSNPDATKALVTGNDYLEMVNQAGGKYGYGSFSRAMESFFIHRYGSLSLLKRATPSKRSFVADIDLGADPASILPLLLSEQFGVAGESCPEDAASQHISHKTNYGDGCIVLKAEKLEAEIVCHHDVHLNAAIVAWGDFNADGFEDLLLSIANFAVGGTMRNYDAVIVTRHGAKEKTLKLVDYWRPTPHQTPPKPGAVSFCGYEFPKHEEKVFCDSRCAVDVTPLDQLENLRQLDLSYSGVTVLDTLPSLSTLETLDISETAVQSVAPLLRMPRLKEVKYSGQKIRDLRLLKAKHITLTDTTETPRPPRPVPPGHIRFHGDLYPQDITELSLEAIMEPVDLAPLAKLTRLTSLSLASEGVIRIENFGALASLKHLKRLDIGISTLGNLAPLRKLAALEELRLGACHVSSLAPLAGLVNLRVLELEGVRVKSLAPLKRLRRMTTLTVTKSRITEIAALGALSMLRELTINDNEIDDLTPLAPLIHLETLDASNTDASRLPPLKGLTALTTVWLSHTGIENTDAFAGNTAIEDLWLSSTPVADLDGLRGLDTLKDLRLGYTAVTDITPIETLKNLETLYLQNSAVSSIAPLDGLTALTVLNISGTRVTNIRPLAELDALHTLSLSGLDVDDWRPLARLRSLKSLYLNESNFTDTQPLAALPGLETLWLTNTCVFDVAPIRQLSRLSELTLRRTLIPVDDALRQGWDHLDRLALPNGEVYGE